MTAVGGRSWEAFRADSGVVEAHKWLPWMGLMSGVCSCRALSSTESSGVVVAPHVHTASGTVALRAGHWIVRIPDGPRLLVFTERDFHFFFKEVQLAER